MDPEVASEIEWSGGDDPDETAAQHAASQRSAEEHDLQEGVAGLSRLAAKRLGLDDLLTRVATFAVKAIPGG